MKQEFPDAANEVTLDGVEGTMQRCREAAEAGELERVLPVLDRLLARVAAVVAEANGRCGTSDCRWTLLPWIRDAVSYRQALDRRREFGQRHSYRGVAPETGLRLRAVLRIVLVAELANSGEILHLFAEALEMRSRLPFHGACECRWILANGWMKLGESWSSRLDHPNAQPCFRRAVAHFEEMTQTPLVRHRLARVWRLLANNRHHSDPGEALRCHESAVAALGHPRGDEMVVALVEARRRRDVLAGSETMASLCELLEILRPIEWRSQDAMREGLGIRGQLCQLLRARVEADEAGEGESTEAGARRALALVDDGVERWRSWQNRGPDRDLSLAGQCFTRSRIGIHPNPGGPRLDEFIREILDPRNEFGIPDQLEAIRVFAREMVDSMERMGSGSPREDEVPRQAALCEAYRQVSGRITREVRKGPLELFRAPSALLHRLLPSRLSRREIKGLRLLHRGG